VDEVSSAAERRARFAELHSREAIFVMPNPWDVGSAKLLASCGAEALATTSAGFAWTLGRLDGRVGRDELIDHVAQVAAATPLPLNADSERCFPDDEGGVAETVRLLGEAGAAGCSIEDWNPVAERLEDIGLARERVAEAARATQAFDPPLVLTGRCENHLHGVDDLDDTIARLLAYRDAGAACLYAPGLVDIQQIARVVDAVGAPVNVLTLAAAPPVHELAHVGVRRISTGGLLASAAYGALLAGTRELLGDGTSRYAQAAMTRAEREEAFG
jgi:2-methylisocitrate lyase-like PEP mutase family enzyme